MLFTPVNSLSAMFLNESDATVVIRSNLLSHFPPLYTSVKEAILKLYSSVTSYKLV